MSVPEFPGGREHSVPPRMAGGCATVFIALLGVVLLMPRPVLAVFPRQPWPDGARSGGLVGLWFFTFLIAALGIVLIRYAIRAR